MNALQSAIDELANDAARQQFPTEITLREALTHCDVPLMREWIKAAVSTQSPQGVLGDVVGSLTDAQAHAVLDGLAYGHLTIAVILYFALMEYVADDLRGEAHKLSASLEPSDAETYAASVADPVRDDLRSLARESRR